MSTIEPGPLGKPSKVLLVLALFLLLLLLISLPAALEGLFFIISGKASQIVSGFFYIGPLYPAYSNLGQSAYAINQGDAAVLYAYWSDSYPLDQIWLETNETGAWENKTIYGSPLRMNATSGWSNFTWNNPAFSGTLHWRIYANDSRGSMNATPIMSLQVTPGISPPSSPPSGEWGGGGPAQPLGSFTVDTEFLKASVTQGETLLLYFEINNTGYTRLNFTAAMEKLGKYATLSESSFSMDPGESKNMSVSFASGEGMSPDVYQGRILLTSGNTTVTISLIVEVRPKNNLFSIYVSLPETPFIALPGEDVYADIMIYNLGDIKPANTTLFYSLRDFDGNHLVSGSETLTLEEQELLKRGLRIPHDTGYGFYLFYARLEYGNQTAASSGLIEVVKEKIPEKEGYRIIGYWMVIAFSVAVAACLLACLLIYTRHRKAYMVRIVKMKKEDEELTKYVTRFLRKYSKVRYPKKRAEGPENPKEQKKKKRRKRTAKTRAKHEKQKTGKEAKSPARQRPPPENEGKQGLAS